MDASAKFWNRTAARYARQPVADEAAYQHKLEATRALLTPEMNVLEFGCGTGTTALHHAPHVGSILAIDFAEGMIEIARGKARDMGVENVRFEVERIETLDADDESFDLVMGHSILHLLSDRPAAIAKVARLLKPGGHFVSSTALLGSMNVIFRWLITRLGATGLIPRVWAFSREQLIAEIEAGGFVIEQTWQPAPDKPVFIIARKTA